MQLNTIYFFWLRVIEVSGGPGSILHGSSILMSILIQRGDFTLLGIFNVLTDLVAISLSSKMPHQMAVSVPPILLKMETTC